MARNKLTQSQAARCAGVSRTQIHRLVKSGGLSVERDEHGTALIDPSELLRVYPKADLGRARVFHGGANRASSVNNRDGLESEALRREIELLRERVRGLEADKAHLRAEADRLLGVVEQQQRLLAAARHDGDDDRRRRRPSPPPRPWPGLRTWWRRLVDGAESSG